MAEDKSTNSTIGDGRTRVTAMPLLSRYLMVGSEGDAKQLIQMVLEDEKKLSGLLIFLDSNLVLRKRSPPSLSTQLCYLISSAKRLNICVVILTNDRSDLDKRIQRLLEGSTQLYTKPFPKAKLVQ